jgi:hypothetical protein
MTTPFHYSTSYILDKSHFAETFDASAPVNTSVEVYWKSMGLMAVGFAILYFSDISPYAAWFIVVLGCVDACSIYFKKPWWLARQMISEAANSELTLTIDERGVRTHSFAVNSSITWDEVHKIEQTHQGWLLYYSGGKNYLSNRCLSQEANEFIMHQATSKSS